jgi:hypothetical protein
MLLKLLRFAAAFIVSMTLWWYATPNYNAFLSRAAEPLVRIDARLRTADLTAVGRNVIVTGLPTARIPADQLTYNVVLFVALFATIPGLFRKRAMKMFFICIGILVVTHIIALAVSIESTCATQLRDWSESRYPDGEQDFWTAAEYVYRLAGMFGISFALWWVAGERLKDSGF